jgi:hypothetical protein
MSAQLLEIAGVMPESGREQALPEVKTIRPSYRWSPEQFARAQIRGLVQQVFSPNAAQPVRQVVFSAIEPDTDVAGICRHVGESLAIDTLASIAIVTAEPSRVTSGGILGPEVAAFGADSRQTALRQEAVRLRSNLWMLAGRERCDDCPGSVLLHRYLAEIRGEFEYSIVEGTPAGTTSEAVSLAQLADGMVLVLSARRTRRASALRIKQMLQESHVRILGTVLGDREFPIPDRIYRRL